MSKNTTVASYVYLVQQSGTCFYKIGFSHNPEKRIKQLQTACPVPLHFVFVSEAAKTFEESLHRGYAEYRCAGEWFNFPDRVVSQVLAAFQRYKRYKPKPPQSVEVSGLPDTLDEIYPALCRIEAVAKRGKDKADFDEIGAVAGRLLELFREDAAEESEAA